jgi:hypothetical protein
VEQPEFVRRVVEVLESAGIKYMLAGSVASMAYGEPRMTQDVDVIAALRYGDIAALCRQFPFPEYYVSEEAARRAIATGGQFNIIHPSSGNKVDMVMAQPTAWGDSEMARRQRVKVFPDLEPYLASPEDVIIGKMLYYQEGGSEKHTRDITGILRMRKGMVDHSYIEKWARELGLSDIWRSILVGLQGKG